MKRMNGTRPYPFAALLLTSLRMAYVLLALIALFPGRACAEQQWTAILSKARTTLDAKSAIIADQEKELPLRVAELRKNCVALTTSMELMLWAHRTDYDNPLDLDDVIHSLEGFDAAVEKLVKPCRAAAISLTLHARELEDQLQRLNPESWIQKPVAKQDARTLRLMFDQASALAKRIGALRTTLSSGLEQSRKLKERLRELLQFFKNRYLPAVKMFYLEPSPTLLTAPGRASFPAVSAHWLTGMRISSMEPSPSNLTDWIILAALTLCTALAIMKIIQWVLRTLDRIDSRPLFGKKTATHAGAWAGAGIALFAAVSTMHVSPSAFFRAVSVILLSRGMILLSESFHGTGHGRERPYLLSAAWYVLATGNMLQGLLMPEQILSLVMAVGLSCCAYLYIVRAREESGLEKALCLALAWPWLGIAAAALFGWGNLAVLAADCLFALYLSLRVGMRMTSALNQSYNTDPKTNSVAHGVILAFSFPLLLLLLAGFIILMTLAPLGGFSLFCALLEMQFAIGDSSLTFARLLSIIGLFFLTQSCVAFTRDYITGIAAGSAGSLRILVSYAIWAVYILTALYLSGIPLDSLTMVGGGLSVGIGFGLKNIVNNFFSGLILLFSRSVQPGDTVEVSGETGRVEHVGIRNTVIQNTSGKTVFVPNSELVSKTFVNWSHKDPKFRMSLEVPVPRDADPETVAALLQDVLEAQPGILQDPPPKVSLQNFGQDSLDFEMRFWIPDVGAMSAASELRHAVIAAFEEHGIDRPVPRFDVRLRQF